ncbi:MAG: hypothetical protein FJ041_03120 [Candidatus Cloacimonetes bacterium]|nr:hypothetical protein [Candidatus Cloacimonadota bacterium]
MKKPHLLLVAILIMTIFFGCSEKDKKNPVVPMIIGYLLEQFISQAAVHDILDVTAPDSADFRKLYAYQIISSDTDAWSPRLSSQAGYDLAWEKFKAGYLVPSDDFQTWFADPALPNAFNVKRVGVVKMYRKIDIIAPDNSIKHVELKGLTIHQVPNWDSIDEDAIKLSDLLTGITAYDSVAIVCYDDYGIDKIYHPDAINDGFYLLETERTIFPTATIANNMKKMKKVAYLKVYGPSASQNHSFGNASESNADLSIPIPSNLNDYTGTEIIGYE